MITGYSNIISVTTLPLLLDLYPSAAAAYSVRKLRSGYTGSAIRVRRSSDNTEQNIGFDSTGNLDTSALTTFCGSSNGFVTTWYDQSGNTRDATQGTAAYQSRIVNAGTVELLNTKPCINTFLKEDIKVYNTTYSNLINRPVSIFLAYKVDVMPGTGYNFNIGGGAAIGGGGRYELYNEPNLFECQARGMSPQVAQSINALTYAVHTALFKSSSILQRVNGVDSADTAITGTPLTLASNFSIINSANSNVFNGQKRFQETIIYESDQTSNRVAIESNINSYYGIY
jgi:hypothetical protein